MSEKVDFEQIRSFVRKLEVRTKEDRVIICAHFVVKIRKQTFGAERCIIKDEKIVPFREHH